MIPANDLAAPLRTFCRAAGIAAALLGAAAAVGCFGEKSFPMVEKDLVLLTPGDFHNNPGPPPARTWARIVHDKLAELLEEGYREALTCDDLRGPDGKTVDVYERFGVKPGLLQNILFNYFGLLHTAQVVSGGYRGNDIADPWPGFEPFEMVMEDGLRLCGRMAPPTKPGIDKSYIVVAHGLFGNLQGSDQFNHAQALRAFGHHVVSVEMRGHGLTQQRNPDHPIEWGVGETRDLLAVSRTLRTVYGAKRVGLLAFCSTSHHGLLTAWVDARRPEPTDASSPILRTLPPPGPEPEFNAGMLLVSPPINYVGIADRQRGPVWYPLKPVTASLEQRTAERLVKYGRPPSHRIQDLIEFEVSRSRWMRNYPAEYPTVKAAEADYHRFMDLRKPSWEATAQRLERIRVPVLVLHAANDPLARAQEPALLLARVKNPNCALLMLSRGGHAGFPAYCAAYYYSLMRAFFDPATAPRAYPS